MFFAQVRILPGVLFPVQHAPFAKPHFVLTAALPLFCSCTGAPPMYGYIRRFMQA